MLTSVFQTLELYPEPIFFVGGCLRQFLLNLPIHDYDFVCEGSAIGIAKRLSKQFDIPYFVLDAERDIARVVISQEDTLDFASLQEDSLLQDLALRDLSINAMAYPVSVALLEGHLDSALLIDPTGGYADLQHGVIRGLAEANFVSDPLRLLRVFRFAAQHGFSIAPETLQWVEQHGPLLKHSAIERILSEFEKILRSDPAPAMLQKMFEQGFLSQVIPLDTNTLEANLRMFWSLTPLLAEQRSVYFQDCLTGERSRRQLCLLFVLCFGTYFRHLHGSILDDMSSGMSGGINAKNIMSACKQKIPIIKALSNSEWSFLQRVCAGLLFLSTESIGDNIQKSRFFRQVKSEAEATFLLARVIFATQEEIQLALAEMSAMWKTPGHPVAYPQDFLSGHRIAELLNEKPGPHIGLVLNQLMDAQAMGLVSDEASAVAFVTNLSADNS